MLVIKICPHSPSEWYGMGGSNHGVSRQERTPKIFAPLPTFVAFAGGTLWNKWVPR